MTRPTRSEPLELLPYDGEAWYHGVVFEPEEAAELGGVLRREIPWAHDELVMFGRRIVTSREVAWFGDREFRYAYSGTTKEALRWTPTMEALRDRVEKLTGARFNSCLANLYHDGSEGMGWHSDDERTLVEAATIASLSFGAERRFRFKHKKSGQTTEVLLEDGSLLEMKGETQRCWQHCLPKTTRVSDPRINLTFRQMIENV